MVWVLYRGRVKAELPGARMLISASVVFLRDVQSQVSDASCSACVGLVSHASTRRLGAQFSTFELQ